MRMAVFGEIEGKRHRVGTLETIPGREEQFSYDPAFSGRYPAAPLSVSLPFQEEPYPARKARPFFKNLLPEGAALAAVAKKLEVKSSSYLKVLDALGSECIGAVLLEREEGKESEVAYGYEPLSRETIGSAFREGAEGVAQLQEEAKLSLAGAQSKMGLYLEVHEGTVRYALPRGSAPSTHIVKASSRRFEQLSENENFCLRVAESVGLGVPDSFIDVIEGQPLFVIERFDRKVLPEVDKRAGADFHRVARMHQEDFCQILGLLPERKYETGGVCYAKRVGDEIAVRSTDPVKDLRAFAKLLVFNAVVGNCDGHLKNITAVRGADWRAFELAPVYDVASTVVYQGLDRHMAMRIGRTNKIDEVERDDFLMLAAELALSEKVMMRLIDEVCEGALRSMSGIAADMENSLNRPLSKLADIERFARGQIDRLGA
ncbi:HipA domain-containing protein [uncultured Adlercreutzia sp.]|uniref:HipA domain-containing protein n=1 Tax=uncultured Adlercreutzia sp. TaxID=875803 RepID=UPI002676953F|nr:HipA domain-containing protein [uncultured Adlercreutzia sp.]